jgi:hypothetical protein
VVLHSPRSSGITIENLTPQLGEFFGTKGGRGVLIRGVEKGSRAETAGLRAGDVIVKINGSPVNDCSDFSRLLRTRTGDKASVTVLRDRKEQTMTLTFPEPKRSGSVSEKECEALGEETCLAMSQPEIAKADMARLRAEAERLSKQHRHQTVEQREELKHEMEKMHQDFGRQQREIEQERNSWKRDAEI